MNIETLEQTPRIRRLACSHQLISGLLALALMVVGLPTVTNGMPPHPELRRQIASSAAAESQYLARLHRMRSMGVDAPDTALSEYLGELTEPGSAGATAPFAVAVLLVDFDDNSHGVAPGYFDTLLFDSTGPSMRSYYDEVSGSRIDLVTVNSPSNTGWYRAPEAYSYYVAGEKGIYGDYPNNVQGLVEDLVDLADADVDFSRYDNNGDGVVDALIVVHAGRGAEYSGSVDDIHSHKWAIYPREKDGVYIQTYTMQPEYLLDSIHGDMTIGVFCHELGHVFGLPDLYDVDYSSYGAGKWCLMSYGSWNGPGRNGSSPAYPSAWCRYRLGYCDVVNIDHNVTGREITAASAGGAIYRAWSGGATASAEYFLIENRQLSGFDSYLPGAGLLIWHIDEDAHNVTNNNAEWYPGLSGANHYLAALEQADGGYDLEHHVNSGDGGDPFPGTAGASSFDQTTLPASDTYLDGATTVAVSNISNSAMIMTADISVGLALGYEDPPPMLPDDVELGQNYPNPFNPSTTIELTVRRSCHVAVEIYNIAGRRVRILTDCEAAPGVLQLRWNGTNDAGRQVATGVYFYLSLIHI